MGYISSTNMPIIVCLSGDIAMQGSIGDIV